MITVAIISPQKIAIEDFLISTSRRDAIRDPVHAPVPGRGIPTNSSNPKNSYRLIWSVFHLNDQAMKQFCFLQNFKNLTNKQ